ncbi:T9SS type B sorting domain-containing protein, partial [Aquimarina sp. 2201CG5-10]|uniref:T9SS type B sorting domain-containing protein n=1 Tax=Aquimarina callyspongiae TaxID=3098150 RepID=UPI002AB52BAD
IDPADPLGATPTLGTYSCNGSNAEDLPDITVDIVGGVAPYSITYTGPISGTNLPVTGTQFIILDTPAGSYDITITDDNNCTFTIPTQNVGPFPIMSNPVVTLVDRITCDAPNAELVTVSVDRITGNTNGFQFDLLPVGGADVQTVAEDPSGTTTSGNFNLPAVGTYIFRITDLDTGCSIDTAPYEVLPFDTIVASATLVTDIMCFGDTNGEISLDVSGYTGAYNYTITNTITGTSSGGAGNTTANPLLIGSLPAGTYEIFVEALDTPFCDETTNTVTLASPSEIMLATNLVSDETCNPGDDASIEAVATGGTGTLSYQLETSGGAILVPFGSVTLFENLDAGDYVVRVRDGNNCEVTDPITITPPNAIAVVAPGSTLLCFDSVDGTITATASGGQGTGTYFFMLTFPDGTQSTQFSSTTDSYTFIDLAAGDYIVTVSDNLNCTATANVTIDAPTEVTITVDTVRDPSCANPTADIEVTAAGGTPPYEYSSDGVNYVPGANPFTFTNLAAGDYTFFVRDSNGCVSSPSNTVPVREPEPLAVTLDLNNTFIICFSEATGSIDATVTGGLGNYMYTLTGTDYLGAAVNIGPQTTSFFGDLLAGDYVYSVTSEDCGPEDVPFTITQPTEFIATAVAEDITCNGEVDGRIIVTATGGTPNYVFSLFDSAGNALFTFIEDDSDSVLGEHIFDGLPADTYRVELADDNGCPFIILDIIINEPPAINATISSTTPESCAGFADGTATVAITGGVPGYFWSITGVDGSFQPVVDPTNLVITDLPGGVTTLFIRDSNNSSNCELPLNLDIEPGVMLNAVLSNRMDCPVVDSTTGAVTQAPVYYIDFILGDNSVTTDIIYTLTGINGTANPVPSDSMTGTFVINPGEYEGSMLHANGCSVTVGTIIIEEYTPMSLPVAQMTGNPQDPNEYEIIVTGGSGDFTYFVTFEGEPERELDSNIFSIRETGNYTLRVVDNMACEVQATQLLTYINIRIPNYFTPDGDGSDDYWYPDQISPNDSDPFFFENMEVRVFDRYGRLLAEFVGEDKGWDGIYQGKELPSGDYWFTVILNDVDNREFTGHFTLYR